jgi:protein-tyrosine phosphatase
MIDMHCHILPGIDDGADDLDTSLAMAKIACDHGTTAIMATPHVIEGDWLPPWETILASCESLQQEVATAGMKLQLYPGAEVALSLDILSQVTGPGPYCLNGGRYMLVELPAMQIPLYTDDFFFTLQARGITPILAHPERHSAIAKDPGIVTEWIEHGVLVQINAPSLLGRMGERAQVTAELLLMNNRVQFIGSDAHGLRARTPKLSAAGQKIQSLVGREQMEQLMITNPRAVIAGQDITVAELTEFIYPKQTGRITKWLTALWN